ncbi:trna-methyltransferase subunit wdr4 [Stylonychia lemnae]|uniref:Trna-methyltransferase subunit wdr4 n=1 Tax=Stylonychia lemnae TaxID=5949 RepID=A0A077ZS46_STYLE|nr:trna-methyltransferase subunit wdr4 [Stylonychia lemnae]|eukprot:CDW72195.1 trna-methyltransferase subunit wdr4 [Stylonychia lemnae]
MRKAVIKELKLSNLLLLSFNRYLYILQNKQDQIQQQSKAAFQKMKILKSYVWESNVFFDVIEKKNQLFIGEQKDVRLYNLNEFLAHNENNQNQEARILDLPAVKEYKNKKRLTMMRIAPSIETKDEIIEGLLMSDKVGEVRFLNIKNFIEGKKQSQVEEDDLATTLFGHQQECSGFQFSTNSKFLASVDTLKRVRVCDFPNIFHVRQFHLYQKTEITDFALNDSHLFTYSALDQNLMISELAGEKIIASEKQPQGFSIESLVTNQSTNQLCYLQSNQEKRTASVIQYQPDCRISNAVVQDIQINEGDKYTLATGGYLLNLRINPENGIINGDEIDVMSLQ